MCQLGYRQPVEIEMYCRSNGGISTCSARFAKNDQGEKYNLMELMSNLKLHPLILQYIQWDYPNFSVSN